MATLDDLKIDRAPERRSYAWIAGCLLLLAAAGVGGRAAWLWWADAQIAVVRTAVVRQTRSGDAQPTVLNATGYVTARRQATVSSKITGRIVEVHVEEGMAIRDGQVLARLDDTTERSYLALAEAELTAARGALAESEVRHAEATLDLERTRRLLDEGIIGRAEVDTAQAEADSIEARIANQQEQVVVADREVDVRRIALEDTVIRAPFSGIAISKDAQPGEMISPVTAGGGFTRTGVSTIVDMSSLEIEVDVNEAYINRVSDRQRVVATLDAYPDWEIPAYVITTIPAADRQRATVLVRVGFDALDPRILPDMGVGVAFLEAEAPVARADAVETARLWVPADAIRADAGQSIAWVVQGDAVERRAVRLGGEDGADVEVTAGLDAGDRVVVDGPATLADGDSIRMDE